jgi:hypothetical protein
LDEGQSSVEVGKWAHMGYYKGMQVKERGWMQVESRFEAKVLLLAVDLLHSSVALVAEYKLRSPCAKKKHWAREWQKAVKRRWRLN